MWLERITGNTSNGPMTIRLTFSWLLMLPPTMFFFFPAALSSPPRTSTPSATCFLCHCQSVLFFLIFQILLQSSPADVRCILSDLLPSREDFLSSGGNVAEQATHYSVGVQTDYRESETQTDPYSPPYVIRDGTTPSELLQLAAFTWGMKSPAVVALLKCYSDEWRRICESFH